VSCINIAVLTDNPTLGNDGATSEQTSRSGLELGRHQQNNCVISITFITLLDLRRMLSREAYGREPQRRDGLMDEPQQTWPRNGHGRGAGGS
jgi:hypothetical protein